MRWFANMGLPGPTTERKDIMVDLPDTHLKAATQVPERFVINEVPVQPGIAPLAATEPPPPLGPLAAFTGDFTGHGFNTIFRPQNPTTPTDILNQQPNSDNILELNLTVETLSFSDSLGSVPNRGRAQGDIFLNGVPYRQSISDVTDPLKATPIHLEPGIWVFVPPTTDPAESVATVARMASIPHGTTINAQGTVASIAGGPASDGSAPDNLKIPKVDPGKSAITPSSIVGGGLITFPSQTVADATTARIPQDLSGVPAITQVLLDDPNSLLNGHIAGANILFTDVLTIDTDSQKSGIPGGGTNNINFLVGNAAAPNADAARMTAMFWIEIVQAQIEVGPLNAGASQTVSPVVPAGAPAPIFTVTSPSAITGKQSITVTYTQIQYSQNVSLNFQGLSWPHVSVATLVPFGDPQTGEIAIRIDVVQSGDTLSGIASRFGVTLGALEAANPQITNPDLIFPGQVVVIPTKTVLYTVQPGDTLSGIAAQFFGVTLDALEAANPQITNPDLIFPRQVIRIP
jgi:LysM repeat protein